VTQSLKSSAQLTVFFEDPFWVGVFETVDERGHAVCRVVFGAEPTDAQVHEFVLARYPRLTFTEPRAEGDPETLPAAPRVNPKRRQHEARRATEQTGVSSKAQEAMRLDLEQRKKVRKSESKEQRQAEEHRLYLLKQAQKKKKKRGH
jgi:hypothetical protein